MFTELPTSPPPVSRHIALIAAGGQGLRMGSSTPKQYSLLAGEAILRHVVRAFRRAAAIDLIAVVVAPDDPRADKTLADFVSPGFDDPSAGGIGRVEPDRVIILRSGGASRRDSVLGGLRALQKLHWGLRDDDRVLVHDAARPGILSAEIDAMIQALADDPVGGLLGLPVADTTKRVQNGRVVRTESRENLWLAQTPQLFVASKLVQALERHPEVSDEALAMELEGWSPQILEGNRRNLKVTTPQDLAWLERIWKEQ